jgi:hypothetical protein
LRVTASDYEIDSKRERKTTKAARIKACVETHTVLFTY